MPHLKHPLRGGTRWLRQATVIGLGIGLMAGTGLIATASAASAHPDAARASAGHKPTQACVLIVGRRGQVKTRKAHCRPGALVAVPACHVKLKPGTLRVSAPRSVRLGRAVKGPVAVRLLPGKGRLRILRMLRLRAGKQIRLAVPVQGPVAVRLKPGKGRPQILRVVPGKAVRLAGPKGLRLQLRARACAGVAILGMPPRPLVRICRAAKAHGQAARCCAMAPRAVRLGRTVRLKPVRLGKSVRLRIRLAAPVEACAIALPKRG